MKQFTLLLLLLMTACSGAQRKTAWDSGAQRQEAIEDETMNELNERNRNQMPGQSF